MNNLSLKKTLLLAFISGLSIIPLSYLESFGEFSILGASIIDISIGLVFAVLVMSPLQKPFKAWKTVLMIVASIVTYVWVANLAVTHYHPMLLDLTYDTGIMLSGGLGALITVAAVHVIAPLKVSVKSYLMLVILGLISGFIFSFAIDSNNVFINAIGFIVWQVSVAFSLYISKK